MTEQATGPGQQPSTPPPSTGGGGYTHPDQHSFLLQCTLDMKESLGRLEGAVNNLNNTVKDQGEKLDKLRIRFAYVAGGAIIIVALSGYFIDKMWDVAKPLIVKEVAAMAAKEGAEKEAQQESKKQ